MKPIYLEEWVHRRIETEGEQDGTLSFFSGRIREFLIEFFWRGFRFISYSRFWPMRTKRAPSIETYLIEIRFNLPKFDL